MLKTLGLLSAGHTKVLDIIDALEYIGLTRSIFPGFNLEGKIFSFTSASNLAKNRAVMELMHKGYHLTARSSYWSFGGIGLSVVILSIFLLSTCAFCDPMRSPWEPTLEPFSSPQTFSFMATPFLFLVRTYQVVVSPTNGRYCPMVPSCSSYSLQAIRRYGIPMGILMTADRLHRCGHDIHLYTIVDTPMGSRYSDPIEANALSSFLSHRRR